MFKWKYFLKSQRNQTKVIIAYDRFSFNPKYLELNISVDEKKKNSPLSTIRVIVYCLKSRKRFVGRKMYLNYIILFSKAISVFCIFINYTIIIIIKSDGFHEFRCVKLEARIMSVKEHNAPVRVQQYDGHAFYNRKFPSIILGKRVCHHAFVPSRIYVRFRRNRPGRPIRRVIASFCRDTAQRNCFWLARNLAAFANSWNDFLSLSPASEANYEKENILRRSVFRFIVLNFVRFFVLTTQLLIYFLFCKAAVSQRVLDNTITILIPAKN